MLKLLRAIFPCVRESPGESHDVNQQQTIKVSYSRPLPTPPRLPTYREAAGRKARNKAITHRLSQKNRKLTLERKIRARELRRFPTLEDIPEQLEPESESE